MGKKVSKVLVGSTLLIILLFNSALAKPLASKNIHQAVTKSAPLNRSSSEPLFFVDCFTNLQGQPRIYEYPSGRNLLFPNELTSFFSLNIDSWLYSQTEWGGLLLVDEFQWETSNHGWCRFLTDQNVEICEEINIVREKVYVRLTAVNQDSEGHYVGVRWLLDTMIDANDGAYLGLENDWFYNYEQEFCCPSNTTVYAVDDLPDPSMTGIFENIEGSIYRLAFTAWPWAVQTTWDYPVYSYQSITDDSALLIYYNLGYLAPGEKAIAEFSYGIPGDILLSSSAPGPTAFWYPVVCQTHSHLLADTFDLNWFGIDITLPVSFGVDLSAAELEERYIDQGYDFVAITEHYPKFADFVEDLWQKEPLCGCLTNSWDSMEDTADESHVLGIGFESDWLDWSLIGTDNRTERVRQIQNAGGVAIASHPNGPTYGWNKEQIAAARPEAIEIFNGEIYSAYRNIFGLVAGYTCGFALSTWDYLLSSGQIVWGSAGDDFTNNYLLQWFDEGCDVAMLENPSPGKEEILDALRHGRFYAAKGGWKNGQGAPRILGWYGLPSIRKVRVVLEQACYIKFVTGRRLSWVIPQVVDGRIVADFDFENGDGYVRAEVSGFDGSTSFTQPIFINKLSSQTGSWESTISQNKNNLAVSLAEAELNLASGQSFDNVLAETVPVELRPPMTDLSSGIIGECYRFTPVVSLVGQNALSISFQKEELPVSAARLRIFQYTADGWQALATVVEGNLARAEISSLGIFGLSFLREEDSQPPQIAIFAPANNAAVSGETLVICQANDNQAVVEVSLALDDIYLASDHWGADGWQFLVDFSRYPSGQHELRATARDLSGNSAAATVTVNLVGGISSPTLTIATPQADGQVWRCFCAKGDWEADQDLIEGAALLDNIPVAKVYFYSDKTWSAGGKIVLGPDFSGLQDLTIKGWDLDGNQATAQVPITLMVFADVANDFWAVDYIYEIAKAGISQGYGPTPLEYRPLGIVLRDQMAVFIARALAGGDAEVPEGPLTPTFGDVKPDFWAYKYIEYLNQLGIVKGYPGGNYQPNDAVSRDQMAVFVARALAGGDENIPAGSAWPRFSDVQPNFWAYKWIEYLADKGVVYGYPDGSYQPLWPVTRDQMAVYLSRAFVY